MAEQILETYRTFCRPKIAKSNKTGPRTGSRVDPVICVDHVPLGRVERLCGYGGARDDALEQRLRVEVLRFLLHLRGVWAVLMSEVPLWREGMAGQAVRESKSARALSEGVVGIHTRGVGG